MWDWAPEFEALLIFAEHRYYGKTMPYGDHSFESPGHLGYLTVEQALADYADLLQYIKKTLPGASRSQVVSFGGSYGGMLSAWFRMKYPHVTVAALAASAPILHFKGMTPCGAFSAVVTKAFRQESKLCPKAIRSSGDVIKKRSSTVEGARDIAQRFKLCRNYTTKNYWTLREWIKDQYIALAMVNYPYPNNFLNPVPGHPVKSCSELVIPMCSDGVNDVFFKSNWEFESVRKNCEKRFHVTPDVYKAVLMFGGKDISASSNIIFSNGDLDPWSSGGILESISDSLIAIYIKGAAHHLDLRASNPADPQSVVEARALEKKYITMWLKEAYGRQCRI